MYKLDNFYSTDLVKDLYTDKYIKPKDLLRVENHKISTMLKPLIWRNEIFNFPVPSSENNDYGDQYCIGIEVVKSVSTPFLLFRILPDKNTTMYYGWKVRAYKDISSTLPAEEHLELESYCNNDMDCINKIYDWDEEYLKLLNYEEIVIGKCPETGKEHKRRIFYFTYLGSQKPSTLFVYENEIYSAKLDKYISRTVGFRFVNIEEHFNDIKVLKHSDTIKYYGFIVGHYESELLNIEPINGETIDEVYD